MKQKKNESVQEWIPIEKFLEKGIIKLYNNQYIKIIKIIPINFNLKSNLEKQSILNSYKVFLKTCNFDIQILIQSKKENLSIHTSNIKDNQKNENEKIINISEKYIEYIKNINNEKKSSSKNQYIVIKNSDINIESENKEEIIMQDLNDKYFKIKECLARCGNNVYELSKEEAHNTIFSFLNSKKYLNN